MHATRELREQKRQTEAEGACQWQREQTAWLLLGGGVRAHKGDENRMTDFLVHVACYILTKGVKVKVRQMLFAIAECLVQGVAVNLSFLEPLDTATARLVAFFIYFYKSTKSSHLNRTTTTNSQWEGKVREFVVFIVRSCSALRICKKDDDPSRASNRVRPL
jgi:hypothetical protein